MQRLQHVLEGLAPTKASHALSVQASHQRPVELVWGTHAELQTPLHGAAFGARLHGVDLAQELSPAQAEWLTSALWEHGVLHIPGQRLPSGRLERLANFFGAPAPPPTFALEGGGQPLPQVLRSVDSSSNSAAGWHTDLNFEPVPCSVTMLHCQVAPEEGGRTSFASTAIAFLDLPPEQQASLAELEVAHLPRPFFSEKLKADPGMTNVHPLVLKQPQTDRPALYLPAEDLYPDMPDHAQGLAGGGGLVGEVAGMEQQQSHELLRELMLHCTQPQYMAKHDWVEDDLVIWDNASILRENLNVHQSIRMFQLKQFAFRRDCFFLIASQSALLHALCARSSGYPWAARSGPTTASPRECEGRTGVAAAA